MTRLRLPARLARREVLRRPGRTALVALLVALPVAGMSVATTLVRSGDLTLEEQWLRDHGAADAVTEGGVLWRSGVRAIRVEGPDGTGEEREEAVLPAGSRRLTVTQASLRVRTHAGGPRSDLDVMDLPLDDPMTAGILELLEGRPPAAAGEVALSHRAADHLHVGLGDTIDLDRPATAHLRVVGLVEEPGCLGCPTTLVAPGMVPTTFHTDAGVGGRFDLIDLPALSAAELADVADQPGVETFAEGTAPSLASDDDAGGVRWSIVVGAVVLMVMGIVIAAAFAVGARRQLVTLGQLSASGASPATVRLALVLQGTFTGLVGAVTGLVLSGTGLVVFHDAVERSVDHRFGGYTVRVTDQLAAVAVGVIAATLAALIPARTAARVPTLAALAGRRPQHPVPRRLVLAGLAGVCIGLGLLGLSVLGSASSTSGDVWAFVAILGGVCELLGACAIAPALVARLEPLAGRIRGSWRLAARGLARNRARTGAVVSAVAAAGALAVVSTALIRGADARSDPYLDVAEDVVAVHELVQAVPSETDPEPEYREQVVLPSAEVQAAVATILPGAERLEVRTASANGPGSPVPLPGKPGVSFPGSGFTLENPTTFTGFGYQWLTVADPTLVDLVGLSQAGRDALERDGIVLTRLHPEVPGNRLLIDATGETVPVQVVVAEHAAGRGSELLVTEGFAQAHGLTITTSSLVYRSPEPLTPDQRNQIEDLQLDQDLGATPVEQSRFLDIWWYRPSTGPTPFQLELILSGVALVFAVFIVGASLALAAAESKDERDVLTVAGAPPKALARAAGARAWLLAGMGGLLAVPVGFLPVVVFTRAEDDDFPLVFPSTTVALLLVAVPAIVGLVAMATSATAQRLRPVRVSTATFE